MMDTKERTVMKTLTSVRHRHILTTVYKTKVTVATLKEASSANVDLDSPEIDVKQISTTASPIRA